MLDDKGFDEWCQCLNLSQAASQVVKKIRTCDPSRRVQSNRSNVVGSYPSFKMGVTIQFESHRNELARIYELEHDPDVLEYYDQPPSIELDYQAKSGRRNRHSYTPDFFVLRINGAGWEECKTEQELIKLAEDSPNRYRKGQDNQWHCPPAEEYAARYGFDFYVWSSAKVNWIFQQNMIWLEDYLRVRSLTVSQEVIQAVTTLLKASRGITLAELLQQPQIASPNEIYTLIAVKCQLS
ncbi:Tn7 transposase TnsA N-terminal domain-containing protein [Chroococcidiopsidales cyanobacterium LEGE 13417]|nr:Tn7 transposase TnsA N-terminal domain-containing protein [Chroococcidiopsidales cyanobacterium LEGE 13417]